MAASHELVVGLGDRRYRVERPFGSWPANAGFVSDVAVDARGHVFVGLRHDCLTEPDDARVVELDSSGNYLTGWGGNLIADLHLLTATPDGRVLVVDRDMHEVLILDRDGRRLGGLGQGGRPLSPFNHPSDVAVAPSGDIYVSDGYAASLVHRFSAAGEPVLSFGGLGREPGRFMEPHAIWALRDGRIAVVDRVADRVQMFEADGTFRSVLDGFYRPVAIWGDGDDNLFVTDSVPSLHMFDAGGTRIGRCRPVLNGAHGIFGTPAGDLLLAESSPSRITRLRLLP